MGVAKTESRIPESFQAFDLGEAVASSDGRCTLISFVTGPIVLGRDNEYTLFVTDAALAAAAHSFEWSFTQDGDVKKTDNTERSITKYQPEATGTLTVTVRILDAAQNEQATLAMDQDVVPPSAALETLIEEAWNSPGPGALNPDVLREMVNEHCRYYQSLTLQAPESGDGFQRFVFSLAMDGAARHTTAERREHLGALAAAVNEHPEDFPRLSARGAGVCNIRPALLAMTLPLAPGGSAPFIPWTELPEVENARAFADEQLRGRLATLSENVRIDLVNILRFPKSNITHCGHILEALRNRYFVGATFDEVLKGMSGTRAHWITRHYQEGPVERT